MMNRIKDVCKKNLTRILLFAVVISFGFTLVLSTNAKYLSYLNSHTHAQAGEFYFESTYLTDDHVTYTVNTWNRTEYTVLLQFMNFKNSLLYNQENQGFYYQLEANLYTDDTYTTLNSNYDVLLTLSEGIEVVEFGGKNYYYFPQGKQDTFSKVDRIQGVEVKVSLKEGDGVEKVESRQYLRITAKTMSSEDLFYYNKTQGGNFKTSEYPVFERELSATFVLEYNPNVEIRTELKQSKSSSEVDYRITYAENIGVSEAKVKVYFNKEKLEIDRTLGYELFEDPDKPGYYYLQTEVYSTGMRNIVFFKTRTSDTISDETDVYSVLLPNG